MVELLLVLVVLAAANTLRRRVALHLRRARADSRSWLWRRRQRLMRAWQLELVDVYRAQLQPVHVRPRPPPFMGHRPPRSQRPGDRRDTDHHQHPAAG